MSQPYVRKKGLIPVNVAFRLLIASITTGSRLAQSSWRYVVQQYRQYSTTWLARSVILSVSGQQAVDNLRVIFSSSQILFYMQLTNQGPLSETIAKGRPQQRTRLLSSRLATASVVVDVITSKITLLDSRSVMTIIVSARSEPDGGSPVIKSNESSLQIYLGIGSGFNRLYCFSLYIVVLPYTLQF